MKRYVVQGWVDQSNNPFLDHFPVLEAPVEAPLPNEEDDSAMVQNQDDGQEEMPGAGPVEDEPIDMGNTGFEDENVEINFETEKLDYINLALQTKNEEMMDKLLEMRDIPNLTPGQYKFIEDNIQVLSLSRDADFADAQKKIYKEIKNTFEHLVPQDTESPEELEQDIQQMQQPSEEPQVVPEMQPSGDAPAPSPEQGQVPSMQGMGPESPLGGAGQQAVPGFAANIQQPGVAVGGTELAHYNPAWNLKNIKLNEQEELDPQERPDGLGDVSGTELMSIFSNEIDRYEMVKDVLQKLPSFYSMKADLFRKTIASLMNAVQIGSGGTLEDLFIPIGENGVGIKVCTRFYTMFGNIQIGKWSVQFNDPENFLSDVELEKLTNSGSPEEKEILRKRVVIESLSENFKDKVYVVMIVNPNTGQRHEIGFNFSELVKDGWKNGYISVDFKASVGEGSAGVKVDGELIDLQEIHISYVKTSVDKLDEEGMPSKELIDLLELKNEQLYLTISQEEFINFVNDAQAGIFYSSKEFDRGPEELKKVQRCVPDIKEIVLRQC